MIFVTRKRDELIGNLKTLQGFHCHSRTKSSRLNTPNTSPQQQGGTCSDENYYLSSLQQREYVACMLLCLT